MIIWLKRRTPPTAPIEPKAIIAEVIKSTSAARTVSGRAGCRLYEAAVRNPVVDRSIIARWSKRRRVIAAKNTADEIYSARKSVKVNRLFAVR
jgi:hypothetical protein